MKWINQPIFVSSTFLDMQVERDFLRDVVFPELEEKLRPHRIALELIDLRWGVDTLSFEEDRQKEIQILKVCFDEIDRSRPFILAFVGNRYGWIPPETRVREITREKNFVPDSYQKSMTALEMEYALLHAASNPVGCFFYFKSISDIGALSPVLKAQFSDGGISVGPNATRYELLERMKQFIKAKVDKSRVFSYDFHAADQDKQKKDLATLKQSIVENVYKELLHVHHRQVLTKEDTWQAVEAELIAIFIEEKSSVFEGRENLLLSLQRLCSHISNTTTKLQCIVGPPGSGKSALLSKLITAIADKGIVKLIHIAGIGPRTVSVENMLIRWIYEMTGQKDRVEMASKLASLSYEDLRTTFHHQLGVTAKLNPILILVDALDQFERSPEARYLTWLPEQIPPGVIILMTAIEGEESASVKRHGAGAVVPLETLIHQEAVLIINAICEKHHKSHLHPKITDAILGKSDQKGNPAYSHPLWLKLIMEQLLLLDEDDFARTSTLHGDGDENLHRVMLDVVKKFPSDSWAAYQTVFKRTNESLFRLTGIRWVHEMLEYLALSRFGFREEDLKNLLAQYNDFTAQFAIVRRYLRSHLVQRGELGLWIFTHRQARDSVLFNLAKDSKRWLNNKILTHFEKSTPQNELAKREIMVYYYVMEDHDGAAAFLLSLNPTSAESQYAVIVIRDLYFHSSNEKDALIIWFGKVVERIMQLHDEVYISFDEEIQERMEFDEEQGSDWVFAIKQERKNTYMVARYSFDLILADIINAIGTQGDPKHLHQLIDLQKKYSEHNLIEEEYLKGSDILSVIEIRIIKATQLADTGSVQDSIKAFEKLLQETLNVGLFEERIAYILVRVKYAIVLYNALEDLEKSMALLMTAQAELEELHLANGEAGLKFYGKLIVESHFYMGEGLVQKAKYKEAYFHFELSLKFAEQIQYENLGTILSSLGRLFFFVSENTQAQQFLERSIAWYKEKIIRDPENSDTRFNLSNQYYLMGTLKARQNAIPETVAAFKESQKNVRQALEFAPTHPIYLKRSALIDLHLDLTHIKSHLLQHGTVDSTVARLIQKINVETQRNPSYNQEAAISLCWFSWILEQQGKWEPCRFCLFWSVSFYSQSFTIKEPAFLALKEAALSVVRLIKLELLFGRCESSAEHITLAENWYKGLYQKNPQHPDILFGIIQLIVCKGEYFAFNKRLDDARKEYLNSKHLLNQLIQHHPSESNYDSIMHMINTKLKQLQ